MKGFTAPEQIQFEPRCDQKSLATMWRAGSRLGLVRSVPLHASFFWMKGDGFVAELGRSKPFDSFDVSLGLSHAGFISSSQAFIPSKLMAQTNPLTRHMV